MMYSDTKIRSVLKSCSWRGLGAINGIVIASIILGDWTKGVKIGVVANLTATALYYFHERVWNAIKWGKNEM